VTLGLEGQNLALTSVGAKFTNAVVATFILVLLGVHRQPVTARSSAICHSSCHCDLSASSSGSVVSIQACGPAHQSVLGCKRTLCHRAQR